MIKMIVFDMAGTTVNEDNLVYKTVQECINEEGFNFSLSTVLSIAAGKEKLDAIRAVLAVEGIENDELANRIFSNFKNKLTTAYNSAVVTAQPNATEVFNCLKQKGITVVLNTGYNKETALLLIEKIGWKQGADFDLLITASDVDKSRPHPDMILLAMKKADIQNAKEVVKVGDSGIDIEEGRNAGCFASIGITTGAQNETELLLAKPDYIIHNLNELFQLFVI